MPSKAARPLPGPYPQGSLPGGVLRLEQGLDEVAREGAAGPVVAPPARAIETREPAVSGADPDQPALADRPGFGERQHRIVADRARAGVDSRPDTLAPDRNTVAVGSQPERCRPVTLDPLKDRGDGNVRRLGEGLEGPPETFGHANQAVVAGAEPDRLRPLFGTRLEDLVDRARGQQRAELDGANAAARVLGDTAPIRGDPERIRSARRTDGEIGDEEAREVFGRPQTAPGTAAVSAAGRRHRCRPRPFAPPPAKRVVSRLLTESLGAPAGTSIRPSESRNVAGPAVVPIQRSRPSASSVSRRDQTCALGRPAATAKPVQFSPSNRSTPLSAVPAQSTGLPSAACVSSSALTRISPRPVWPKSRSTHRPSRKRASPPAWRPDPERPVTRLQHRADEIRAVRMRQVEPLPDLAIVSGSAVLRAGPERSLAIDDQRVNRVLRQTVDILEEAAVGAPGNHRVPDSRPLQESGIGLRRRRCVRPRPRLPPRPIPRRCPGLPAPRQSAPAVLAGQGRRRCAGLRAGGGSRQVADYRRAAPAAPVQSTTRPTPSVIIATAENLAAVTGSAKNDRPQRTARTPPTPRFTVSRKPTGTEPSATR